MKIPFVDTFLMGGMTFTYVNSCITLWRKKEHNNVFNDQNLSWVMGFEEPSKDKHK